MHELLLLKRFALHIMKKYLHITAQVVRHILSERERMRQTERQLYVYRQNACMCNTKCIANVM